MTTSKFVGRAVLSKDFYNRLYNLLSDVGLYSDVLCDEYLNAITDFRFFLLSDNVDVVDDDCDSTFIHRVVCYTSKSDGPSEERFFSTWKSACAFRDAFLSLSDDYTAYIYTDKLYD